MSNFDIKELSARMEKAISSFNSDLSSLRTGRASSSMLDPIMVDAYGSKMPINQVGNITIPEPRTIAISVWDKGMVPAVEKAIMESNLGLNPANDGTLIRIPIPELNEERRKELAKVCKQYAESARVAVRHVRRDGMDQIAKLEKSGDISKDDLHNFGEDIQKLTDQYVAKVDETLAAKEKEIMQV